MVEATNEKTLAPFLGYALSLLLVIVYVQLYPVYRSVSSALDTKTLSLLPIGGTALILGFISLFFRLRRSSAAPAKSNIAVIGGVLICCAALAVTDPAFPVKRVHVAEYLLLSLAVRFAMSYRLQDYRLLLFSACFTTLLGVHDEFLQGLHPSRTYGLRDMGVNGLGSLGGALIWHGMGLFNRPMEQNGTGETVATAAAILYFLWLVAAIAALVWPLSFYRGALLPFWPAVPLFGTIVYWTLYRHDFGASWKHGLLALSLVSFPLVLYPLIATHLMIFFY